MATRIERKAFEKPDETRPFKDGKGKVQVVTVGDHTVGRGTFEPGWRWSEHVKPIAGTPSCQAAHNGYVLEGRMVVKMDDGTQVEYGPGDAFHMPPGQLHCNRFPSNPIHSVPGTQRTSKCAQPMSALTGKADIAFFGREGENAI